MTDYTLLFYEFYNYSYVSKIFNLDFIFNNTWEKYLKI